MQWYRGKKVFITGGSSGIGKAAAKLLAHWGASVMVVARGQERLEQTLEQLRAVSSGGTLAVRAVDVTDRKAVQDVAAETLQTLGGLDVLINNAGIAHPGYIAEIPDDIFESMMQVNYFGTVNTTRAFVPHFMQQKGGHVCNVSSLVGFMGIFGYSAYAASKFAISGFSECLRQDLLPYNVSVSVAFPPDTNTPQLEEENRIKPPETKAIAGNVKVLQPQEVAQAILEGIAAERYHIVPGLGGKFTYYMYRHFPWMVRFVIDSDLKRHLRRAGPRSEVSTPL